MSPVKSARTPLWSRLAQALANDIVSGKYPVDSLLPTEMQLMELHDVSRHTVREALAELVQLGLIERRPRSGTRVIAAGDLPVFHPVDLPHHPRPRTRQVLDFVFSLVALPIYSPPHTPSLGAQSTHLRRNHGPIHRVFTPHTALIHATSRASE